MWGALCYRGVQPREGALCGCQPAAGEVPAAAAQHRRGRGQWLEGLQRHAYATMHHHGEGRGSGRLDRQLW